MYNEYNENIKNFDFNKMNLNQAAYVAYQNMFKMNPNFGINDHIQMNNNLKNFVIMNPNIFLNNRPQPNIMHKFQVFGNPMNDMGTGVQEGIFQNQNFDRLPRPNQRKINNNFDSYPWYKGPRINIIFEVSTGMKINIAAPVNETVEGLLKKFCEKVGVNNSLLKRDLICIFNANKIDPNDKTPLQQFLKSRLGFNVQAKFIIFDAKNIIGA